MRKYFRFFGTISGTALVTRTLLSILMLFPLLILLIFWWTNTFLNLMGLTLSEAGKIDQREANKFGEELGIRIAENPSGFFSEILINTGFIWYILLIVLIIPVIWFWLANLYKRVSAIFISNRKKVFFFIVFIEIILLVLSFLISKILFTIFVIFKSLVFFLLVFYPSPIGEHEG
ncbi:MAG: hypothetical protein VYB19_01990 [Bacteroidota bacterium]|nr:hypothetical protein [Bacteroidota bacterium]MEE2604910.1 hypothetical protein [Bacteroidota bacterium]